MGRFMGAIGRYGALCGTPWVAATTHCSATALPLLLTLGDAVHNAADGVALGAAFSASWRSGVGTAVAVLLHELPHELGDMAALLRSGLSAGRAVLLNAVAALPALVGAGAGLAVGSDPEALRWVCGAAAGIFLYVALCDMMPALLQEHSTQPWLLLGLHCLGSSAAGRRWLGWRCWRTAGLCDTTGAYWDLLGSTGIYWDLLGSTGLGWTLLGTTGTDWALLGAAGGQQGSVTQLGSTGANWDLLGPYWDQLGPTGTNWEPTGTYWDQLGSTGHC
ncbi:LOW QUALITY PROTEIN: zinc transporter ZIP4 [Lagopus muta]|uniref:LOW QUALITY PROTEIN: zinc transporter ZIP4 n=1 Tax=Lagopus muta TaxID=64668 RepID=UPI00209E6B7D|nr:LOW QUALITY PROTEIN: zinc transporter ZIP4 [Lagopus muta]